MMGGTETESRRKRKRKTRSERNHLAHRQVASLDVPQQRSKDKTCTATKTDTTTYSLRSCKPRFSPVEVRKTNGVSITKDRLTRRVGLLAGLPTSECISREPGSNLGDMNKKANILHNAMVEQSKKVSDIDQTGDQGSPANEGGDGSNTDKQAVMTLGTQALCPGQDNTSASSSMKDQEGKKASLDSVPDTIKSSVKSSDDKEFLDPVLPYADLAESLSKDLKLRMKKVFQSQNLEREICSDLQKLLRQSSHRIPGLEKQQVALENDANGFDASFKESKNWRMDEVVESSPGSSKSSLPTPSRNSDFNMLLGETCPSLSSTGPSFIGHTSPGISAQPQLSAFPANCLNLKLSCCNQSCASQSRYVYRSSTATKTASPRAMDIHIEKDEESDEEKMPALLLAQYHAFLLSSRKLNARHRHQRQSSKMKEGSHSTKPLIDSAIRNGDHPLCPCESCYYSHHNNSPYLKMTHVGQNHEHHRTFPPPYSTVGSKHLFDNHQIIETDGCYPNHSEISHQRRKSTFESASMFKEADGCMPNHLEISRHRLKTALESVSAKGQARPCCNSLLDCSAPNRKNSVPFGNSSHPKDEPMECLYSGHTFGQMKRHQIDLQARDFLDELEQEFSETHWPSHDTERNSLLSDSILYTGRPSNFGIPRKGPSTQ